MIKITARTRALTYIVGMERQAVETETAPQRMHTVCCWCGIVIHQADPSRGVSHGLCSSDACYERQAGHPRRPDVKKGGAK